MSSLLFSTKDGRLVPAVTVEQMRKVDRIAMDVFGLGILQMMENAGRSLAQNVIDVLGTTRGKVTVLVGAGGNGGGGLCCARHLHNRGFKVNLVLDREVSALRQAATRQFHILQVVGLKPINRFQAAKAIQNADLVVDALIGYSLRGAPRGRAAELIEICGEQDARVLSLDVPSGLDAATGETLGLGIQAERTLTLALPKTGLHGAPGDLYVADIGIPPEVYRQLGLMVEPFFRDRFWVRLEKVKNSAPSASKR